MSQVNQDRRRSEIVIALNTIRREICSIEFRRRGLFAQQRPNSDPTDSVKHGGEQRPGLTEPGGRPLLRILHTGLTFGCRGPLIPSEAGARVSEKIKGSISLYSAHVRGLRGSRPSSGVPGDSVCLSRGICLVTVSADTLLWCCGIVSSPRSA